MQTLSVLISVYIKEQPTYLDSALYSIYDEQISKPDQIVLVKDGTLTAELDAVITQWKAKLDDILTVISLKQNVGLARALNEGLKYCKYELVARMDSDDRAMSDRFHKQIRFMLENPDIVVSSGLIEEWNEDFSYKISERILPLTHDKIYYFAKSRNPISHPAVIFRKSAVLNVGGYPTIYPEDYPLWGIMLVNGYQFANLPDLLLKMRVGNALIERRGKTFLIGEIQLFHYLHKIGFLNRYELYRNILQRSIVRQSPLWIKKLLYKYLR